MCLEIGIIFLALIASVSDDVLVSPAQMLMHAFQEGDERGRVCRLRGKTMPCSFLYRASLRRSFLR
jgi:hypothetical protein